MVWRQPPRAGVCWWSWGRSNPLSRECQLRTCRGKSLGKVQKVPPCCPGLGYSGCCPPAPLHHLHSLCTEQQCAGGRGSCSPPSSAASPWECSSQAGAVLSALSRGLSALCIIALCITALCITGGTLQPSGGTGEADPELLVQQGSPGASPCARRKGD